MFLKEFFVFKKINLFNKSAILISLNILIIIISISCGLTPSKNNFSSIKHNINEPVRNTDKWNWYDLTEDDFNTKMVLIIKNLLRLNVKQILDDDNILAERMNLWLNKIHKNLQNRYPQMLVNVPKPKVKIINNVNPNAFVPIFPVCLNIPLLVNDISLSSAKLQSSLVMIPDGIFVYDMLLGSLCGDGYSSLTKEDALSFVEWMNNSFPNECRLSLKEANISNDKNQTVENKIYLLANNNCAVLFNPLEPSQNYWYDGAAKVVYLATANTIFMTTALAALFDEQEFVSILAHELGHYYRSHLTIPFTTKEYNYFYKLEERNPNHKPKEDKTLAELGNKLVNIKIPNRAYRRVKGQTFRSEIFKPMILTAKHIATTQNCYDTAPCNCNIRCEEFVNWFNKMEKDNVFGKFPFDKLSQSGINHYFKFERKISACFKNVKIGSDSDQIQQGNEVFAEVVKMHLKNDEAISFVFDNFSIKEGQNLLDLFNNAQAHLELEIKKVLKPLEEAKNLKIGYYTLEQEADEVGLEIVSQIGIQPQKMIEAELKLLKFVETEYDEEMVPLYPFAFGYEQCKELYRKNWRDADGNYVFVSIADYSDPHHSLCYRIFNLDREIEAHGFKTYIGASKRVRQVADSSTWQEIIMSLNKDRIYTGALDKQKFYLYGSDFRYWVKKYLLEKYLANISE